MNTKKIISIYQILGSIYGFYGVLSLLYEIDYNTINILIFSPFLILYLILFIAGILLYRNDKHGKKLSIIIQSLQIIQFSILGVAFKFGAGIGFIIGFKNTVSKLYLNFIPLYAESSWYINDKETVVLINFVPIFLIYKLVHIKN